MKFGKLPSLATASTTTGKGFERSSANKSHAIIDPSSSLNSKSMEIDSKMTIAADLRPQSAIALTQGMSNVICGVCLRGDTAYGDSIILCDSCDVAVHQSCYGINEVPEGEWYCDPCKYMVVEPSSVATGAATCGGSNASRSVNEKRGSLLKHCELCYKKDISFPLKRTAKGRWIHVVSKADNFCALTSSAMAENHFELFVIVISKPPDSLHRDPMRSFAINILLTGVHLMDPGDGIR